MRSKGYDLDISKSLSFLMATMVIISSIWSLTVMTEDALAAPDKFGTDQLYSTADEDDAPAWFLNNEDPEDDENFMMTLYEDIELEEAEGEESGVFKLDAEIGNQEHVVRIHADSPGDEWKNVEMTGYFKLEDGEDEIWPW
jgi:hypothetical protein